MSTFSATRVDTVAGAHRAARGRWLVEPAKENALIGGGRNNQVFRWVNADGTTYALKRYFRHPGDSRDRLDVEFKSLTFLWAQGVRCVPQPLHVDPQDGLGLYEYMQGVPIPPAAVKGRDIDAAVDFLGTLRRLTAAADSRALGPASEACASVRDVHEHIEQRCRRLLSLGPGTPGIQDLRRFLEEEFQPVRMQLERWSTMRQAEAGGEADGSLSRHQQTLSPSDFGFHNALRRPDGSVIFLDFEYFGWDDPAKMVVDFLLHPQMRLSEAHKRRFLTGLLERFEDAAPQLQRRIQIVYPLFGLKWCLILLNEFLPDQVARRQFASPEAYRADEARAHQLQKAQQMLEHVRATYDRFANA